MRYRLSSTLKVSPISQKIEQKKNYFPATVGVPKSLLIIFEIKFTLCANFLVTNSKTLSEEDTS